MSKEELLCESFRAPLPSAGRLLSRRYTHFRLDRQGLPVSPATLHLYEHAIGRFLPWVRSEHPEVRRFEDLCAVRPLNVDADAPAWRNQVDNLSRMVTAWTGNEARVVEFSEDEVRSMAGHDPLLASIRAEGMQLAGDESLLRPNQAER
jgi:hypothetical protein